MFVCAHTWKYGQWTLCASKLSFGKKLSHHSENTFVGQLIWLDWLFSFAKTLQTLLYLVCPQILLHLLSLWIFAMPVAQELLTDGIFRNSGAETEISEQRDNVKTSQGLRDKYIVKPEQICSVNTRWDNWAEKHCGQIDMTSWQGKQTWADLKFVKKFTRPNFRAKEFYTLKMRKWRLFSPAINSKNASLSVIWPSFG